MPLRRLFIDPLTVVRMKIAAGEKLNRVLGIDPGLNITGYGVLQRTPNGPRVIEAGVVRGVSKQSLTDRLVEIHRGVVEVIATLQPDVMALEQLYSHIAHPRTSILMGHARGVICLAAAQAGIP